jgi:hypothetical protein
VLPVDTSVRRRRLVIRRRGFTVADLVDIAIPLSARQAAETLGLKVIRHITSGAWVRRIPRDEAEIAVECLRDWGIAARIVAREPDGEPPSAPNVRRVA